MKLDRNANLDGKGKYALIKMRDLDGSVFTVHRRAAGRTWREFYEIPIDAVDFGVDGDGNEFFVIRLKDKYAAAALFTYAAAAQVDDPEYADEVRELADQAEHHRLKKRPD